MIPYSRQDIDDADIEAVADVLRSDLVTQGSVVPAFERAIADYCGAVHAVAVNSGTSALHLACLALGVGPGDRVWTSPNTFVASANCALYCGAQVDFVDIDPRTYNLSVEALADKLARAERAGALPKVVIPVHFAGQPCDLEGIHALGRRYGFSIIEDASHAIGASYQGAAVGSGRYSALTVFSFHPVKLVTTAEGGMVVTNDEGLARRVQLLRSHGIARDPSQFARPPDGPWYYEQVDLGFNYRLSDVHAALGLSQLRRLDAFVIARRDLAARYDTLLSELPVVRPTEMADRRSARHLYAIRLAPGRVDRTQRQVFESLRAAQIGVQVHYIPVYYQPYYERLGFRRGCCPEAERYYHLAMSLPLYPGLRLAQQDTVVSALAKAVS